jgi:hypothetical protein
MKVAPLVVVVLLATACGDDVPPNGGGTAAPATDTAATDTATAAAPGAGVGTPFCRQAAEQQTISANFSPIDPASVADAFSKSLDALRALQAAAPPELRADLAILVEYSERYSALLSQHGYDILAVPPAEFDALFTLEVLTASERFEGFCGLDSGGAANGWSDPIDADAAIEALLPPGAVITGTPAPYMVIVQVDASFDEVIDHYRSLVGPELSLIGEGSFRLATFLAGNIAPGSTITVSNSPSGVEVVIAVSP